MKSLIMSVVQVALDTSSRYCAKFPTFSLRMSLRRKRPDLFVDSRGTKWMHI